jgi:hypothetical protein
VTLQVAAAGAALPVFSTKNAVACFTNSRVIE